MSALTGRYTNSPESRFESDLALLRDLQDGEAFIGILRQLCSTVLTGDYWKITLPSQLATSASRSPSLFAYHAALVKLDALVLFSPLKMSDMLDPTSKGTKASVEQHHLFPKAYLESLGVSEAKNVNQIANFAAIEWPENLQIGKKGPADYAPDLDKIISGSDREKMYFWHALPPLWWQLPYEEFLLERRVRMAAVIKTAWLRLTGDVTDQPVVELPVNELIASGETEAVEFKSTLRINLHTGSVDEKIQHAALKTLVAFLNAKGGTLLVGVADSGEITGISADNFANEDKMGLHLVSLVRDRIGELFLPYVHPHFEDQEGLRVLVIRCERGPVAAFVKDGAAQRFFVRSGNATTELNGPALTQYVKHRFA